VQPDLYRGDRTVEKLSDLGVAEVIDVVKKDDGPIVVR
jgi:hypothetical protein